MRIEHNGEVYHLLFKHQDNRWQPVVNPENGDVIGQRPSTKKEIRRAGLATTTCTVMRETGTVDDKGHWVGELVAQAKVRCNPIDSFNRAHGRWYALDQALRIVGHKTHPDTRLVRALWKGYYSHVAWRPDGRDGFKIRQNYDGRRELARVA